MNESPEDDGRERIGFDSATGRFYATYDRTDSVSTAVVLSVSAVVGVEPGNLPTLTEAVDPDALDALFADDPDDERARTEVTFAYANCEVTACDDGTIGITAPSEMPSADRERGSSGTTFADER